jgi:hypothetical protein
MTSSFFARASSEICGRSWFTVGMLIVFSFSAVAEETVPESTPASSLIDLPPPDYIPPDSLPSDTPPPLPSVQINPPDTTVPNVPPTVGDIISPQPRRFQYNLRLSIRGVYDDNINISHFDRISDYYFVIEPEITVGLGDIVGRSENYLLLTYIPSVLLFVDHSENNAVEHLIHLEAQHRFSRLTLNLTQDINLLDGASLRNTIETTGQQVNLDVSGRTRLNFYSTHLKASYDLSGKTFLTSEIDALVYDYPSFISSEVISGNLYINYNYSPKMAVGIGGTAGYNFVDDPNPDQTFEQVNLRLSYQATGKVSLNASGGVEFRQFEHDSRGTHISPVFQIGVLYQPFDGTRITLTAGRRILNSGFFAAQDFTSTNVIVGISQRLFGRVYLGLSAGYENSDYFSTMAGVSATRRDDYYFVQPSIDIVVTRYLSVGAYYLHRQDSSTFDFFSFYDNQFALRATLKF